MPQRHFGVNVLKLLLARAFQKQGVKSCSVMDGLAYKKTHKFITSSLSRIRSFKEALFGKLDLFIATWKIV
jgi:hypothetical protein